MALDNSGPGRSAKVRKWLRKKRVVALFNVPHTPQHNAFAESIIGDLKRCVASERAERCARWGGAQCELASSIPPTLAPAAGAAPRLPRDERVVRLLGAWARAAWSLNACTPRPSLSGLTPDEP